MEYLQLRFRFNSPSLTRDHFHRNYPFSVLAAFYIIFLGTLANTHSDLHFHPFGVIFACMSVICNASYQLLVQGDKSSSLYERTRFLQIQSLTSALILFPSWPFIDPLFDMNQYTFTDWSALMLLLLCGLLAFVVNSSVIWCIKDAGAVRYNMIGQLKTLVVIFIGSALFGELLTIKQIIGIVLATAGCLMYAYVTYRTKESHKHQQQLGISNI
jgi:drug/metabolite transporter (DMT)-like permease